MNNVADDETRRLIDAEVHQLRLRICDLLSKRNSLAPISRLPPELMSIIFVYAQNFSKVKSRSRMAMHTSWICHNWRQISLGCLQLWGEIDFTESRGVLEFVSRSRQTPLSITLPYTFPVTDFILHSTDRIRAFDLSWDNFKPHRPNHLDLHKIWTSEAPLLQSLSLCATRLHEIPLKSSCLQHLKLNNCAFEWTLPFPCSLITLSIIEPTTSVSLLRLLSKLAGLPALTALSLEGVISTTSLPTDVDQLSHPSLGLLTNLKIKNKHIQTLVNLIDHITVSTRTLIEITVLQSDGRDDPSDLISAIRRSRSYQGPVTFLQVIETPDFSSMLFVEQETNHEKRRAQTSIQFDGFWTLAVAEEAASYLDLSSLRDLEVSQMSSNDLSEYRASNRWIGAFGKLANLRSMKVYEHAAYLFVQFLEEEARGVQATLNSNEYGRKDAEKDQKMTTADREKKRLEYLPWFGEKIAYEFAYTPKEFVPSPIELAFRGLRHLVLDFPDPKKDEDDRFGEAFREDEVDEEKFVYNLDTRRKEGVGLKKVVLRNWPISDEALDKLDEIVEMDVDC